MTSQFLDRACRCAPRSAPVLACLRRWGPENNIAFIALTESFLARHLGGRAEPIGDGFKGSSVTIPQGGDLVPGAKEALLPTAPPATAK